MAEHKDIEDEGQTVTIEERVITIHTNAADKATGEKMIVAGKEVTVIDTVALDGLERMTRHHTMALLKCMNGIQIMAGLKCRMLGFIRTIIMPMNYKIQKTMIDQIVSASHQNAGSPVRMEAELSAVSDKMEMDTVCGELSAAEDIHQMPSEISSGYLYVDNRIAPTAQVEVLEYNIYGTKYYEIRNDGFEFKFLESRISIPPLYTQQFEIGNLSFGYELSVYSNVADRLILV